MAYSSGVYTHVWGEILGGHSVKIIGWGESNGKLYWVCANSWGLDWGLQGEFNIFADTCGISDEAIVGMAAV
jgi:hypothetical protein